MNVASRIKLCRLFLLIGLSITFFTSVTLLAWHEHIIDGISSQPFFSPPTIDNGVLSPREQDDTTLQIDEPIRQPQRPVQDGEWPPILSVYTEPPSSTDVWFEDPSNQVPKPKAPLPMRHIDKTKLTRLMFPRVNYTSIDTTSNVCSRVPSLLPIDDFGSTILDPYLPWIHDLFISHDGKDVNIIAQNRRRCHKGKFHNDDLKFWEGELC